MFFASLKVNLPNMTDWHRHDQEAKSSYKTVHFQVSRPLRIPESGEITLLFPFRKAEFTVPPPFTVGVNGFVTIVATQSLQLGAVSANNLSYFLFIVVVSIATLVVVVFLFWFTSKNGRFDVSRKCDVTNRIFKI